MNEESAKLCFLSQVLTSQFIQALTAVHPDAQSSLLMRVISRVADEIPDKEWERIMKSPDTCRESESGCTCYAKGKKVLEAISETRAYFIHRRKEKEAADAANPKPKPNPRGPHGFSNS